jgi:hypothetical protein
MAILPVGIGSAEEGGYQIERSLRFNSADSTSLNRTPGSASNRKTWTWSGWVKRCEISDTERVFFSAGADGNNFTALEWINSKLYLQNYTSGVQTITNTTAVFRDASAWYHIVLAIDTTQATSANRAKIYVNGVQQAGFSGSPFSLNQEFWINYTYSHRIGARQLSSADAFSNQYMAEVNFIDGSALDPTSFGEYNEDTGVWQPKAYTGARGTNGFYLDFADNSSVAALGYDAAGSNDWSVNGISVTAGKDNDSLVDTPTNYGEDTGVGGEVRGNYATMNPLDKREFSTDTIATSNGNLDVLLTAENGQTVIRATTGVSSEKYYCEVTIVTVNSGIGVADATSSINDVGFGGVNSWTYYSASGNIWTNGGQTAYGSTYTTNDIIGIAIDMDSGKAWFAKNGTWQNSGSPTGGTNAAVTTLSGRTVTVTHTNGGSTSSGSWNFGQRPFAYTAPSGFKALCTQNLPEPTIVDGGEYFDVVIDTGANIKSASEAVYTHQWAWIKDMDNVNNHQLVDSVRGTSAVLQSNTTAAETTYSTPSGESVAWVWSAPNTGVSNTDGSITSTVSANTTSGISICTYTGTGSAATVGHGLDSAPEMMIIKNRDTTNNWFVYTSSLGATKYLLLNTTVAEDTSSTTFNNVAPTSSVFSVGTWAGTNGSTNDMIAYCFAAIPSFSAMGSYLGNGSADGPFVYTGFKPRYLILKRSSAASVTYGWQIYDTARSPYNTALLPGLWADTSAAEAADTYGIDLLSNGFKLRSSGVNQNGSGDTYIYAAFAENPFKIALAR